MSTFHLVLVEMRLVTLEMEFETMNQKVLIGIDEFEVFDLSRELVDDFIDPIVLTEHPDFLLSDELGRDNVWGGDILGQLE
jgi:hypothetical protein